MWKKQLDELRQHYNLEDTSRLLRMSPNFVLDMEYEKDTPSIRQQKKIEKAYEELQDKILNNPISDWYSQLKWLYDRYPYNRLSIMIGCCETSIWKWIKHNNPTKKYIQKIEECYNKYKEGYD
jgi:hypothetical protein